MSQNSQNRSAQSGPFTSRKRTVSVNPASMATLTTQDVSISFPGAKVGDAASVQPLAALESGILAGQASCLVADTVTWRLANVTAGTIDPAAVSCVVSIDTAH